MGCIMREPEFLPGDSTEGEWEGMDDIGGLRQVDGKSKQQIWMRNGGLNRVPGLTKKGVMDKLEQLQRLHKWEVTVDLLQI